jgi:hypothetical protein
MSAPAERRAPHSRAPAHNKPAPARSAGTQGNFRPY